MSLRPRAKSAIKDEDFSSSSSSPSPSLSLSPASPATTSEKKPLVGTPSSSSSSSSSSVSPLSQALAGTASLANLLPTGTLLAFQLLTPSFTNHGLCDPTTRLLSLLLLLLLAISCFLASFTDSISLPSPSHGGVYYGLATPRGLWLFDYPPDAPPLDTSRYRLRPIDFVHAALSVLVFAAVALRDKNVVSCFYPTPEKEAQEVLDILPLGVGVICGLLFVVFPTTRHGIGYPVSHVSHSAN